MSKEDAWELLCGVRPDGIRIGPYVYIGFPKSELSSNWTAASALASQVCITTMLPESNFQSLVNCHKCAFFSPEMHCLIVRNTLPD